MFPFLRRDTPCLGSVWFRGTVPPHAEEFAFLQDCGIAMEPGRREGARWHLHLRHRSWGEAQLWCQAADPPPRTLIDHAAALSQADKELARLAGTAVVVSVEAAKREVLRDRKRMLWFAGQVMGRDGVVVLDHSANLFWSRSALDDELSHDADLDICALFCVHAVCVGEERPQLAWVHTHGLDQVGAFDFDILEPSPELLVRDDVLRALAFAVVEGLVSSSTPSYTLAHPDVNVRFVPVEAFHRYAHASQRALRATDPEHMRARAVLCNPARGWLGRWSHDVVRSDFLTQWNGADLALNFSAAATALMAERARKTVGVLQSLMAELGEFGFPVLAKLGYLTDHGGPGFREHLWFQVHSVGSADLDATLESSPFDMAGMKSGDRGRHSLEQLTDWLILTPLGAITPRSLVAARRVREHREQLLGPRA